ncbi:hypothetical protein FG081_18570 [Vibrio cholerae]|nr:hypothetical protein [Vibrio cholerae]EGQ9418681.1 hypothetical protein [Vibrio cholerae]EGR0162008.1 hypothetical protein [Vibrio cholerae]EGR0261233.1 hypothetical protein [Vibrio cholerae]EGR0522023.1 hypothetical protein [Vibrio cholerae]
MSVQILEFLYRLCASRFVGCFNSKSRLRADSVFGVKSLLVYLPISLLAWQLSRQFAIVLRFGWKERALVERWSGCLIGLGRGIVR